MVKVAKKDLGYYKKLLPKKITVQIHKTEEGFWAEIKEFSNCYTQADSFVELIKMVNDAVCTHLEIPVKYRKQMGYYMPESVINEIKRRHWESVVADLISTGKQKKKPAIFQLNQNKLRV